MVEELEAFRGITCAGSIPGHISEGFSKEIPEKIRGRISKESPEGFPRRISKTHPVGIIKRSPYRSTFATIVQLTAFEKTTSTGSIFLETFPNGFLKEFPK